MSDIIPIPDPQDFGHCEYTENDGAPLMRCGMCKNFSPIYDQYSEQQGAMFPLVGHWKCMNQYCDVCMAGSEIAVRILPPTTDEPEGGTLTLTVKEQVSGGDKFGG
jgi:hypothetical protein